MRAAETEPDARVVSQRVRDVMDGQLDTFAHEYRCHGPGEEHWYRKEVTTIASVGAVVSHADATADHIACCALEEIVEEKDRFLTAVSQEIRRR